MNISLLCHTSLSKVVFAGWDDTGAWAKEFSKSVDFVGVGASSENKSTSAAGLAGSGALTRAGLEVGRGWAMLRGGEEGAGAETWKQI